MMDFHYSTWGYRIEPTESGSRVTEWSDDLRPESVMEFSKETSGVDDRGEQNRQEHEPDPRAARPEMRGLIDSFEVT